MKSILKFLMLCALLATTIGVYSQQTLFGTPPESKISKALLQKQVTHIVDLWEIEELKSENKMEVILEAVQYKAINSTDILKGVKLTFIAESGGDENVAKSSKEFEAYIDESEYSEILVLVNQIITDLKKKEAKDLKGSIEYTTKSNVKIGYLLSTQKEIAFLTLLYSNSEIRAEFSNPGKFFEDFKGHLDIASKDLYLPENQEKMKKVKKSSQEAKDVIIDDI